MADKTRRPRFNPYAPTENEEPGAYDRDLAAVDLEEEGGRSPAADPDATRLSAPATGGDPDATRLVPAEATQVAQGPDATRLVSDPGATVAAPSGQATRLVPRAQGQGRPDDVGETRVAAAVRPDDVAPADRTVVAPSAAAAVRQRPVADLGRAEAARDMLDRQAAWGSADREGWRPGKPSKRQGGRSVSKGPLARRRLRFWRWFRTIPILLMVLAALLSVGLSVLPGATLRHWLYPVHYADAVTRSASVHGVDPYLVAAVIKSESNWVSTARSGAGAQGLMQIMPDTARELASEGYVDSSVYDPDDLADPVTNIEYGTAYLSYLLDTTGSVDEAVAAYNAGPGAASQWKGAGGDFADAIEYPETRLYLERVLEANDQYRSLYPDGLVDDRG